MELDFYNTALGDLGDPPRQVRVGADFSRFIGWLFLGTILVIGTWIVISAVRTTQGLVDHGIVTMARVASKHVEQSTFQHETEMDYSVTCRYYVGKRAYFYNFDVTEVDYNGIAVGSKQLITYSPADPTVVERGKPTEANVFIGASVGLMLVGAAVVSFGFLPLFFEYTVRKEVGMLRQGIAVNAVVLNKVCDRWMDGKGFFYRVTYGFDAGTLPVSTTYNVIQDNFDKIQVGSHIVVLYMPGQADVNMPLIEITGMRIVK